MLEIILFKRDLAGRYPYISHEDELKALDARDDKTVSTDFLIELVECVLKNNIFEDSTSFCKQLSRSTIGTKMAPP